MKYTIINLKTSQIRLERESFLWFSWYKMYFNDTPICSMTESEGTTFMFYAEIDSFLEKLGGN